MSNNQPPYHFVSNTKLTMEEKSKQLVKPTHHDSYDANTFSGEIRCELKTKTPCIFGAYQKEFRGKAGIEELKTLFNGLLDGIISTEKLLNSDNSQTQISDEKATKSVIFPLVYKDKTAIAGSSIKGMLRHSIAALTSQPMLQVQENTFSYRPNIKNISGNTSYRKTYPAIVTSLTPLKVKIVTPRGRDGLLFLTPSSNEEIDNHKVFHYKGAIDDEGVLSNARPKRYSQVELIDGCILDNELEIPQETQDHYQRTTQHLIDTESGHISSRHPQSPLSSLAEKIIENRKLQKNQLIFIEIDESRTPKDINGSDKEFISSYGNHYYYHWRYKNSVRMLNTGFGETETTREELRSPVPDKDSPATLNIVESLFGYSNKENTIEDGNQNTRLAGRIAVNHALEVIKYGQKGVLAKELNASLPPTGSPKSSAVEFYLEQNSSANLMNTYGDDYYAKSNTGLNGRKFYPHQKRPTETGDARSFTALSNLKTNAYINDKFAPLTKYMVPKKTLYRFSINFRSLKRWELGLLLVSIRPELVWEVLTSNKTNLPKLKISKNWADAQENKQTPHLGVKLGYGRPFGLGSCYVQKSYISLINNKNDIDQAAVVETTLKKLSEFSAFDEVLAQWLKVHDMNRAQTLDYPIAGRENNTIGFHLGIRQSHSGNRRLNKPIADNVFRNANGQYLADLD